MAPIAEEVSMEVLPLEVVEALSEEADLVAEEEPAAVGNDEEVLL